MYRLDSPDNPLHLASGPSPPANNPRRPLLTAYEHQLMGDIVAWLDETRPEEGAMARQRFQCLEHFEGTIAQYPSVRIAQQIHGTYRGQDSLIESLADFAASTRLFHIPTKVVAIRSFLVAKFHAFSLLSKTVQDQAAFALPIRDVLLTIISTIMAEEVYFSCLTDPSFSRPLKHELANNLLDLWDNGIDPQANLHFPALETLWAARDAFSPSFGTMDGTTEMVRLTMDLGTDWQHFILRELEDRETRWALEEFLFGLSYEEIAEVRTRLAESGIFAVDSKDVQSYIGSRPVYGLIEHEDPRDMYDFYVARREAALFRKRLDAPGPTHTLEEIYLKHLILDSITV